MRLLQDEICTKKEEELNIKQIIVHDIRKKQDSMELAYHTQKLLNETRPDLSKLTCCLNKCTNLANQSATDK
ncbi:MAG: hypothetical protein FWC30_05330 [Candidatus Bathyarchaeota archaeon]|nr:hypothetical protein [Candidatus Termiticorpusculum sp.]